MSKESTQPVVPASEQPEQVPESLGEPVVRSALPPESDPSGFTERAPELVSLLPDDALSQALARGDALALHRVLAGRLAREPSGPRRDTLRRLLDQRSLFVVAENPPAMGGFLGTGVQWVGLPAQQDQAAPFIATRAFRVLGVPLWPLGEHLLQRGRDGQLQVLGRVASGVGSLSARRAGFLALGALALAGVGAALTPFVVRDVWIANGLSRPVEVRLEGETLQVNPGQLLVQQVFSLGDPYHVEARWPGAEKPFEVLEVESTQRTLYNILGAGSLKGAAQAPSGDAAAQSERVYALQSEDVSLEAGWEPRLHAFVQKEQWPAAAALARTVFMADPSQLPAGQEAARILMRTQPREALWFARELTQAFPDDMAVAQLAQDMLIALDERSAAFKLYEAQAQAAPGSVHRALMAARVAPPQQVREAYAHVLKRFPESPEALRAVARIRLADGYPDQALERLDQALARAPESLEDLELRVRALVAADELLKASVAVKQYHGDPRHGSWELALLAGRLARIAGPGNTQYVARDLIPAALARSAEHLVAFDLLTGGSAKDPELNGVEPLAREALTLTRNLSKNFDAAVKQAALLREPVLSRVDPETAALLALELSRRGEQEAAHRLFGAHVSLLAARAPLLAYVNSGTVAPEFPWLPPGLQAAAYLIRARVVDQNRLVEQAYAKWADGLGGMARQALGLKEPERKMWQDPKYDFRERPRHYHVHILLRSYNPPPTPPPPPTPTPPPERTGARLPRPWP